MRSGEDKWVTNELKSTISEEVFEELVLKGKHLFILDDLVLDLTDYIPNHPGGAFLLQHNIGRDVSKFFYGGY
jgi:cytochrome b involved in lipid metabolism